MAKACSYGPAKVPLRDRRAQLQSSDQAPWIVQNSSPQTWSNAAAQVSVTGEGRNPAPWKFIELERMNTFGAFPITMPLRSKELLHYFRQVGEAFTMPSEQQPVQQLDDCMSSAVQDPFALRNMLLIAGIHYAWNLGDLQTFEPTFLSHKIQAIQLVNEKLSSPSDGKDYMSCANYIITLSFTECCLGNFRVAEAHLKGLMRFIDAHRANEQDLSSEDAIKRELTDRYLILAYNFVHSLKSRLDDFLASTAIVENISRDSDPKGLARVLHRWHIQEATGLAFRLKTIRLFPYFFSSAIVTKYPRHVDVSNILSCLAQITKQHDARFAGSEATYDAHSRYELWDSGGPSRLLSAVVNAHLDSISIEPSLVSQANPGFVSSWSGFCVAIGMYLTSVLGIWNQGSPAESSLLYHVLLILKQDLQTSWLNFKARSKESQALWIWKWFAGALTIAHVQPNDCNKRFRELSVEFLSLVEHCRGVIRQDSEHWPEVKALLHRVVWPHELPKEMEVIEFWNNPILGLLSS
uniref:Transcription factor domain-containing protein n=1 Tax=Bionectria ochroleuca TaxID=29856 RepID=A0A8H7K3H2_BIOOC